MRAYKYIIYFEERSCIRFEIICLQCCMIFHAHIGIDLVIHIALH